MPKFFPKTRQESEELSLRAPFSLILDDSARRLEYRREKKKRKTTLKWGQKKLLLSEIFFMALYGTHTSTVVYAGAAPGFHLVILQEMFPDHTFILYDPAQFSPHLRSDKFKIRNTAFTNAEARKIRDEYDRVLFISDVRTGEVVEENSVDLAFECEVVKNMAEQQEWIQILRPVQAIVKFRLPYTCGTTMYMNGFHLLQPYAPDFSTETRLVCNAESGVKTYSHTEHEEKMHRFNRLTRFQTYFHPWQLSDEKWDSCAEAHIIYLYIECVPSDWTVESLIQHINHNLEKLRSK